MCVFLRRLDTFSVHVTKYTYLNSFIYNLTRGSPFSWMMSLKGSSISNTLPVDHASSFSSGFFKQPYSISDLGVK